MSKPRESESLDDNHRRLVTPTRDDMEQARSRSRSPCLNPVAGRHSRERNRDAHENGRRSRGHSCRTPTGCRRRGRERSRCAPDGSRWSRGRRHRAPDSSRPSRGRSRCAPEGSHRSRERNRCAPESGHRSRERSPCAPDSGRHSRERNRRSHESSRHSRKRSHRSPEGSHCSRRRREDTPDIRNPRSRSPTFTLDNVINIINNLKRQQPQSQPSASTDSSYKTIDHKNIIPDFDPSSKTQRIDTWIKKVNECADVYGWNERMTIHFAMQKLKGLAKVWYEGLNSILFTWKEWQTKLIEAFPFEQNYGQMLDDMLKRKSKFNEEIEVYYYEKLALLNQCDISGKHAVDCIIHGISDRTTRSSALALRCSHPDQLLQFLMSHKNSGHFDKIGFGRQKHVNVGNTFNNSKVNTKPASGTGVTCFNCKEKGHPYMQCPKPILKCNKCYKLGHKTEDCKTVSDNVVVKGEDSKKVKHDN